MSEIVEAHLPCEKCGSSDANALYDDGHTYCFSCEAYIKSGGGEREMTTTKKQAKDTIPVADLTLASLKKRRITQETCRKYGYYTGFENGKAIQVANYCLETGEVIGQKIRDPEKNFYTRGEVGNRFFGQHLFAGGNKLVITEGEIDCLTVSQIQQNKYPVVSVPCGCKSAEKTFKAQLAWLETFPEVVVMFDMDSHGQEAVESIKGLLSPGKLKIAQLPLKDPNECLCADRAEDVVRAIWNAATYRPDGIINGAEMWEEISAEDPDEVGYDLPWKGATNDMLQGLQKSELVVICAGTGVGKTTLTRQISYHFGKAYNLKIGMMMLEEKPKRTAKGLMGIAMGQQLHLHKTVVDGDAYKAAFEDTFSGGNFVFYNHFGSLESDSLISKMRYLAVAEKCDFIILDHITIAISGLETNDERKTIDMMMTRLRSLVEETGVGMIVISHLKRKDGTPAEEGGVISLSDLRGSHSISQLSDTVIALERNQQAEGEERNLTRTRVLKNRRTGDTGLGSYLAYNKETGILDVVEKPKDFGKQESVNLSGEEDVPF